ncbi:hypothetical protein LOTGIDRAFT_153709 [Lottia gigantea]|uniref:Uncharacterized protein n=1 Tax=Lottia gigantea TaxID=225164 RepID=V4A8A3_LOTGI|nr:hypothetical protein LOTGIDRAFT_153709 [Lottia gigantea]ESO91280.1 hypothetical protein LOTGIDRAFT_153709 [Lottia gigantea]
MTPDNRVTISTYIQYCRWSFESMNIIDRYIQRQLEEDYIEYATRIEREASLTDISEQGFLKCPICNKETICDAVDVNKPPSELNKTGTNICVDCEHLTCSKCGKFSVSLTTKVLSISVD